MNNIGTIGASKVIANAASIARLAFLRLVGAGAQANGNGLSL